MAYAHPPQWRKSLPHSVPFPAQADDFEVAAVAQSLLDFYGPKALEHYLSQQAPIDDPALVEHLYKTRDWETNCWSATAENALVLCVERNLPDTLRFFLRTGALCKHADDDKRCMLLRRAYGIGHDKCVRVLLECHPRLYRVATFGHPPWVMKMMVARKRALQASVALYKALWAKGLERNLCMSLGRVIWATRDDEQWLNAFDRGGASSSWWCSLQ